MKARHNQPAALLLAVVLFLAAIVLLAMPAHAATPLPTGSAANQPSTWVTYLHDAYDTEAQCFKHEGTGDTAHGTATKKAVTLAPYGQDWFGNGYALLVVKAGTDNNVTYQPTAGVPYATPEGKDISHWIVCKGQFPETPPTTTTTQPNPKCSDNFQSGLPRCTPIVPPTTVPSTTSAPPVIVPPTSTSTTLPPAANPVPVSPQDPPTTELAFTGTQTAVLLYLAGAALATGVFLRLAASRRKGTSA